MIPSHVMTRVLHALFAFVVFAIVLCAMQCKHAPAGPLPGNSIYHSQGVFTDDSNRSVSLVEFRGQKVVLAMIYTNCVYICPRIVADMKRLQQSLADDGGPSVRFVAVSFDTDRDSPEALRKYRKRLKLDRDWTLLSGTDADVRELAAILGISYTKTESGDYSHTIAITILNEDGVIVHKQEGNTSDTAALYGWTR